MEKKCKSLISLQYLSPYKKYLYVHWNATVIYLIQHSVQVTYHTCLLHFSQYEKKKKLYTNWSLENSFTMRTHTAMLKFYSSSLMLRVLSVKSYIWVQILHSSGFRKILTLSPQTARKSSFHWLPVIESTVKGIGAEASRVRVNFRLEESACFSKALSCSTVIFPFSCDTAASNTHITQTYAYKNCII